jgi:hypothetical protein
MSVLVVKVIRDVRAAVGDETGSIWDSSADILVRVNDSLHRLWAEKPEAFYVSKIIVSEPAELTSETTGSLPVLEQYGSAVVAHCAYLLLREGRRDGDREAAAGLLADWNRYVHQSGG